MENLIEETFSEEWQSYINFSAVEYTYQKNDMIFSQGEEVKGLFIIKKGKVKVITLDLMSKEHLLRLASNHHILGHRGFGGDGTYPISAICLEETNVLFLPNKLFYELVQTNAKFAFEMMKFYAKELRDSEIQTIHYPASNRVSRAIIKNYEAFGLDDKKKLTLSLSRKDISNMACTTYETTIRVLADLSKKKIVKLDNKDLIITNIGKLREYSQQVS